MVRTLVTLCRDARFIPGLDTLRGGLSGPRRSVLEESCIPRVRSAAHWCSWKLLRALRGSGFARGPDDGSLAELTGAPRAPRLRPPPMPPTAVYALARRLARLALVLPL